MKSLLPLFVSLFVLLINVDAVPQSSSDLSEFKQKAQELHQLIQQTLQDVEKDVKISSAELRANIKKKVDEFMAKANAKIEEIKVPTKAKIKEFLNKILEWIEEARAGVQKDAERLEPEVKDKVSTNFNKVLDNAKAVVSDLNAKLD